MAIRPTLVLLALFTIPGIAPAQDHGTAAGAAPASAPREASQYDFLIGEWELEVRMPATGLAQRIHGAPRLQGSWKAWRAFDGWGIEDELRIVDRSGGTRALTHTMRVYDPTAQRWTTSSLDVFRGKFNSATAEFRDGVFTISSRGTDLEGRPVMSRTRISDITPARFRFRQERSSDEGRTWTEALTIEAKRTAAVAAR